MLKEYGKLIIRKGAPYDKISRALQYAEYTVILSYENTTERHFIIAKDEDEVEEWEWDETDN